MRLRGLETKEGENLAWRAVLGLMIAGSVGVILLAGVVVHVLVRDFTVSVSASGLRPGDLIGATLVITDEEGYLKDIRKTGTAPLETISRAARHKERGPVSPRALLDCLFDQKLIHGLDNRLAKF